MEQGGYYPLPSLKRPRYSFSEDSHSDHDIGASSSAPFIPNPHLFNSSTYNFQPPHLTHHDSSGASSQGSSPGYSTIPSYRPFSTAGMYASSIGETGSSQHGSGSEQEHLSSVNNLDGAAVQHEDEGKTEVKVRKRVIKPREIPVGAIVTEKSCSRCRERKVKCDRIYPICKHCKDRNETCDLDQLLPKEKPKVSTAEAARIAALEKRLAELEAQNAQNAQSTQSSVMPLSTLNTNPKLGTPAGLAQLVLANAFSNGAGLPESPDSGGSSPKPNIGQHSIDWRLATPQMERSLTVHLCDAFFDSCCFVLPTFSYFRSRVPNYRMDPDRMDAFNKAAIAAFSAVGARTSPHSALLGIASDPGDSFDHPEAPLLSAGQRRQNACVKLIARAYQAAFEGGLEDEAKIDNLGSLLAVMQLAAFVELEPKKSRSLLRAALGHFRELQDEAATEDARSDIKKQFAFALYVADSALGATSRKACLITDYDLQSYFSQASIVIPNIPAVELTPLLSRLIGEGVPQDQNLKTAIHLISCWVCACQRMFVKLVCPGGKSIEELRARIPALWAAVDETRNALQYLQLVVTNAGIQPHVHHHGQGHGSSHAHDADYVSLAIRADRDLLDIGSLVHVFLSDKAASLPLLDLLRESTSRVRRGLKTLAFYFKMYLNGTDLHMVFHAFFNAEYNPHWTRMALQRVGDPDGPLSEEEEVSQTELGWFVEGLQSSCYFHPAAEKRLAELQPRFQSVPDVKPPSPSPFSLSPFPDFLTSASKSTPDYFSSQKQSDYFSTGFQVPDLSAMGSLFDSSLGGNTPTFDLFASSSVTQPWPSSRA